MKIFRFQLSLIILREQLMRLLHPRAVLTRNYNGRSVSDEIISSMIAYTFIFLLCLLIITVLLAAMQLDFVTSLSGALTALTNVGPYGTNAVDDHAAHLVPDADGVVAVERHFAAQFAGGREDVWARTRVGKAPDRARLQAGCC